MTKVGFSLDRYYISIRNNNIKFINKINGKNKTFKVKNIYLILELEKSSYPEYVKNNIIINVTNGNLWFKFRKALESKKHPDFFFIPYYPEHLINKKGELLFRKDNVIRRFTRDKKVNDGRNRKRGYYNAHIKSKFLKTSAVKRHRLLCLAFKDYETDPSTLVVNHIDGIPGNDYLENLEWSTYSDNLKHALAKNLMPNSVVKIKTFNRITKEIKHYNSIAEASRKLNKTTNLITKRLNKNVYYSDNILFFTHDFFIKEENFKRGFEPIKIKVVDILTNKKYIFDSIEKASKILNINPTSIRERIKLNSNKPIKNYKITFLCYKYNCPNSE